MVKQAVEKEKDVSASRNANLQSEMKLVIGDCEQIKNQEEITEKSDGKENTEESLEETTCQSEETTCQSEETKIEPTVHQSDA